MPFNVVLQRSIILPRSLGRMLAAEH